MRYAILAVTAMLSVAGPALAQAMSPTEYVKAAGASDLFEKTSSELVLKSTADPKVRSFARMMVSDHAKSTADVKAAASKSGVRPASPMLDPAQTKMIAQLKAENGKARDATYITQQREAHGQALATQQAYASGGTAPALKQAAAKIVPVVQHHIEMLEAM